MADAGVIMRGLQMFIKFWGVHGSLPRPGPTTLKYGGNTPCIEVRCGKVFIIFDAGSGIREMGEDLIRNNTGSDNSPQKLTAHIFFSHLHWDHVQGFPFFAPAFVKGNKFHLYGGYGLDMTIRRMMSNQMSEPNFPLTLDNLGAGLVFHDIQPGTSLEIEDVIVRTHKLNHPGGSLGYRVEWQGKSLVYASDNEIDNEIDPSMINFAFETDVLIHDGMFTPQQYLGLVDRMSRKSWGHSTWEGAVATAKASHAKRLILFHHGNNDRITGEIEMNAQAEFPSTISAYEGMELRI
jgi:phosphoribosyl 1,2-cyclic phosphodiesterase